MGKTILPRHPINLRGLVGPGWGGGKAVKLLSPPLQRRAVPENVQLPRSKTASRQFTHEHLLEERSSSCPKGQQHGWDKSPVLGGRGRGGGKGSRLGTK